MILAEGDVIGERHLRLSPEAHAAPAPAASPGGDEPLTAIRDRAAAAAERAALARALERARGDRTAAAHTLGLTPRRLEAKLREHGLDA